MTTSRVSHLSDARQVATSLNIARRKTDALDLSSDQTTVTVSKPTDIAGTIRATSTLAPLTGAGVEMLHNGLLSTSGLGSILSYDHTTPAWQPLSLGGSSITLQISAATVGTIDNTGLNLATGTAYKINALQVVGARITGWTAATGTPSRGAFAAAAAGTSSAAYVQAEAQGALNRIAAIEARLIAYDADLRTHGLIGT